MEINRKIYSNHYLRNLLLSAKLSIRTKLQNNVDWSLSWSLGEHDAEPEPVAWYRPQDWLFKQAPYFEDGLLYFGINHHVHTLIISSHICILQDNEYKAQVDLPGVSPEKIETNVSDGILTIRAERSCQFEGSPAYRKERRFGQFVRHFKLPVDADQSKVFKLYNWYSIHTLTGFHVKASSCFENGVLTVCFPKVGGSTVTKIPILKKK